MREACDWSQLRNQSLKEPQKPQKEQEVDWVDCNRWYGFYRALISTSQSQLGITQRDRGQRDSSARCFEQPNLHVAYCFTKNWFNLGVFPRPSAAYSSQLTSFRGNVFMCVCRSRRQRLCPRVWCLWGRKQENFCLKPTWLWDSAAVCRPLMVNLTTQSEEIYGEHPIQNKNNTTGHLFGIQKAAVCGHAKKAASYRTL